MYPFQEDCDGKRVYKSVNCSRSLFLHYHDSLFDGRWVVNYDMDKDDDTAHVRNRGDGLDDEECPEKETYDWEFRKLRGGHWSKDSDVKLEKFNAKPSVKNAKPPVKNAKPPVKNANFTSN